jgi:hypothetical protein
MPMVALAAYSIYQGVKSSQQANKAQAQRDSLTQQQITMGQEDKTYYRQKYGPMNQMLVDYAMGNKPSPYLAAAKGQVQQGAQAGLRQINNIEGSTGLGASGIGEGQKLGLTMDVAKANAGLDLQDQVQRYGVAQSLSNQENNSLQGSREMLAGYGMGAGYANQDMNIGLQQQGAAFKGAASALGSTYEDHVEQNRNASQTATVEAGAHIQPDNLQPITPTQRDTYGMDSWVPATA